MASDTLVQRLRRKANDNRETSPATLDEAADRIEALEAEVAQAAKAERDRLRELLQSEAIRGRIGNALDNSRGMLHSYKISVIIETLADALEEQKP